LVIATGSVCGTTDVAAGIVVDGHRVALSCRRALFARGAAGALATHAVGAEAKGALGILGAFGADGLRGRANCSAHRSHRCGPRRLRLRHYPPPDPLVASAPAPPTTGASRDPTIIARRQSLCSERALLRTSRTTSVRTRLLNAFGSSAAAAATAPRRAACTCTFSALRRRHSGAVFGPKTARTR
jgi:hypothetical protein